MARCAGESAGRSGPDRVLIGDAPSGVQMLDAQSCQRDHILQLDP